MKNSRSCYAVLLAALMLGGGYARGATTWTGGAGNDWFNGGNWDGGVPGDDAEAVINAGANILLTNQTANLASLTMNGGTLTFTNWTTKLRAAAVTINDGTVTHAAQTALTTNELGQWIADMRVWISCGSLFVGPTATIHGNGKGYQARGIDGAGRGPGAGSNGNGGGGHGGMGSSGMSGTAGPTYDSVSDPSEPGSSGSTYDYVGGSGGGLVLIDATGVVAVNGTIAANGGSGYSRPGGGAGGTVRITCNTFAGTNGVVAAAGGDGGSSYGGGGGGGRIAVIYDPTSQSNMPLPGVRFDSSPGAFLFAGDVGTLYFSDAQFLTNVMSHSGEWHVAVPFTHWSPSGLLITNGWIRFPVNGFTLDVRGALTVAGTDVRIHKLELTNGVLSCSNDITLQNGELKLYADAVGGPRLDCAGSLNVTNGGDFYVYSAMTNGSSDHGALVSVTGDISVASGSAIYPYSHPTNGGSALFRATNLVVYSGGSIDANGKGFGFYADGTRGYGPGALPAGYGAGYGGVGGGPGGPIYGDPSAPIDAGSGGAGSYPSAGGGLVRVEAAGSVTVDGSVMANGGAAGGWSASGSGGGIYLTCHTFSGRGVVQANGGSVSDGRYGRGGGGRIAILYDTNAQSELPIPGVTFSAAGLARNNNLVGDLGTLYFSDTRFMTETMAHTGQWLVPGLQEWAVTNLTVTNAWLRFPENGFRLTVASNLLITGSSAQLDIGGNANRYPADAYSEMSSAPLLDVGGDLLLTNAGSLYVAAAATNDVVVGWGAHLSVTGTMTIASGSWLYLRSNPTNGGSVYCQAGNVLIPDADAGISAAARGFSPLVYDSQGAYGPGTGAASTGAGHGGVGAGPGGPTYGSSNAPVLPGSAAYNYDVSGEGGGLVRLDSPGSVILNGTISANGGAGSYYYGGGSGGGIYITCRTFGGSVGALNADGGSGGGRWGYVYGGGGGRIAVWRAYHTFAGSVTVNPGGVGADAGTVAWGATGPSVTNLYATNSAAHTADLVGQLLSTGTAPVEVYCYWGQTDATTNKDSWETNAYLGWQEPGVITNPVTDLSEASHYYFRFYATNAFGDNWGTPFGDFSTMGGASVNNDGGATSIASTSARLRGNATAGNPTPLAYICWGATVPAGSLTSDWDHVEYGGTLLGPYAVDIGGLLANKTYYYRCYVTNDNAEGWASAATNFTTIKPTVSINDPAPFTEGNDGSQDLDFVVTLSATSDVPVGVSFATVDGWATAGSDYTATGGVLIIPAGQVAGTIAVSVIGDTADEYPWEDFFVNLSAPENATLAKSQARGVITDDDDVNQTKLWNGVGNWNSFTNWTPLGSPGPADDAVIVSGQVTLSNATVVASLTVSNGATMVFSNWSTKVTAGGVTNNGTMTLPPAFAETDMSNRVWIVCTNLLIDASGAIDVNARGSKRQTGTTAYSGAGYGGMGGLGGGPTYGSVSAPEAPGCAGGIGPDAGGPGGGAVRIQATDSVTVNGTITANGGAPALRSGGGSGGAIFIECRAFKGADGVVRANGGYIYDVRDGRGGGGRIGVIYDPATQAGLPVPSVTFSAACTEGGMSYLLGDIGTLYFPDMRFFTETVRHSGQWNAPGLTSWSMDRLVITNANIRFPQDGFRLTVTNDLIITGSSGELDIGVNRNDRDSRAFYSEMTSAPSLCVGHDLLLTNAGSLYIAAAATNDVVAGWGAQVSVAGTMTIATGSWFHVRSSPTNGGSVICRVGNLLIPTPNAGINASARGFSVPTTYATSGYGPGTGPASAGAGYGGMGGGGEGGGGSGGGPTYGSSNAPVLPGSAAYNYYDTTGEGGGLVRIDSPGSIIVNGMIAANGGPGSYYYGGGSGGGIYITCRNFGGTGGSLTADGGSGGGRWGYVNGGGGGRIAVWRLHHTFVGSVTVNPALANVGVPTTAATGTVVWGQLPPVGSIITMK